MRLVKLIHAEGRVADNPRNFTGVQVKPADTTRWCDFPVNANPLRTCCPDCGTDEMEPLKPGLWFCYVCKVNIGVRQQAPPDKFVPED